MEFPLVRRYVSKLKSDILIRLDWQPHKRGAETFFWIDVLIASLFFLSSIPIYAGGPADATIASSNGSKSPESDVGSSMPEQAAVGLIMHNQHGPQRSLRPMLTTPMDQQIQRKSTGHVDPQAPRWTRTSTRYQDWQPFYSNYHFYSACPMGKSPQFLPHRKIIRLNSVHEFGT